MATSELRVRFTGDASSFKAASSSVVADAKKTADGVKAAGKSAGKDFLGSLSAMGGGGLTRMLVPAAAITAGVAGFQQLVAGALAYADGIEEASQRTGFSIENFQRLSYAANLSGAGVGSLDTAMRKLQGALDDEPTKEQSAALEKLGLSVAYLRALSPDLMFDAVAQAIKGVTNQTERSNIAVALFGRSGTMLLPMIDNMDALKKGATVMSDETVKNLARMKDGWDGLKTSILATTGSFIGWLNKPALDVLDPVTSGQLAEAAAKDAKSKAMQEALDKKKALKVAEVEAAKTPERRIAEARKELEAADKSPKALAQKQIAEEKKAADAITAAREKNSQTDRAVYQRGWLAKKTGKTDEAASRYMNLTQRQRDSVTGGDNALALQIIEAQVKAEGELASKKTDVTKAQKEYADLLKKNAQNDALDTAKKKVDALKTAWDAAKNAADAAWDALAKKGVGKDDPAFMPLVNDPKARQRLRHKLRDEAELKQHEEELQAGKRGYLSPKDKRTLAALDREKKKAMGLDAAADKAGKAVTPAEAALAGLEQGFAAALKTANVQSLLEKIAVATAKITSGAQ